MPGLGKLTPGFVPTRTLALKVRKADMSGRYAYAVQFFRGDRTHNRQPVRLTLRLRACLVLAYVAGS